MLLHAPNQRYKRLKIKNGQNDRSINSSVDSQSQTSKPSKTIDADMKEKHLQGLSFDHGIKSLRRLLMSCDKKEPGDIKHQKKLNLCVRHKPEA